METIHILVVCAVTVGWLCLCCLTTDADEQSALGAPLETDPDSGAQVYLLGGDPRPADNIYGEQPYSDASGRRIAIRYYSHDGMTGGLNVFDLYDGSSHEIVSEEPLFPPFHPWGEYLYFLQRTDRDLTLRRCRYQEPDRIEDIALLPPERGEYSYGTMSPDHRWYAVAVRPEGAAGHRVELLDLQTEQWQVLLEMDGYHAKHEQFSRDGRNRVLIQLNKLPDVEQVLLGEISLDGHFVLFPADRMWTPRPTGHECWIGETNRIFYSTRMDERAGTNIFIGAAGDEAAKPVSGPGPHIGHVAVSKCGRYWVGDTSEDGIPIYIGNLESERCKRFVFSRTVYDGNQWAHAHPYLTADNKWLIFTARRGEQLPQVYGARLPEGWLDEL
ncbi:MAG: hypothetical protein GX358_00660 [candidate division WS1 bacterium]|jgi:Tol biopolymer transport system component|nr:hypothetical protein [candidate division WS1 bacterium]